MINYGFSFGYSIFRQSHIELVHGVNLNQQTFHWGAAPPWANGSSRDQLFGSASNVPVADHARTKKLETSQKFKILHAQFFTHCWGTLQKQLIRSRNARSRCHPLLGTVFICSGNTMNSWPSDRAMGKMMEVPSGKHTKNYGKIHHS